MIRPTRGDVPVFFGKKKLLPGRRGAREEARGSVIPMQHVPGDEHRSRGDLEHRINGHQTRRPLQKMPQTPFPMAKF